MNRTEKTDLQGYAFIRSQLVHTGVSPSLRQIATAVGHKSPYSAQLMLQRLEKRGLVTRIKGTIRLAPRRVPTAEHTVNVPLVGSVSCGAPMLAEQRPEALIPVSTRLAIPGHNYFLLRAHGSSMNRSGISDGDLLLVREQSTADEGQRVAALINDDATIKLFHREGEVVILRPNSTVKSHKPIVLSEDFLIQGVVIAVLPKNVY